MMQDLPQLLCQSRINIDGFLSLSKEETEKEDDDDDDNQPRKETCCIESQLTSPDLPILGDPDMVWKDIIDFGNIFKTR